MTINDLKNKKARGEKIIMLTAYDYPLAEMLDQCGVDVVLVGDSVANVVLGLASTREVDIGIMVHHAKAVRRAVKRAMVVGDMPHDSLHADTQTAVAHAQRFVAEVGCDAVKVEWFDRGPEVTAAIVAAGIPVMGHVGLTPQTVAEFKVQGRDAGRGREIVAQALRFQEQGCFSLVLECVPDRLAQFITQKLDIPTIGIGAGPHCDGQVLVTPDLLGLYERFRPKFAKRYVEAGALMRQGIAEYCREVQEGMFPDAGHSFVMQDEEFEKLKSEIG